MNNLTILVVSVLYIIAFLLILVLPIYLIAIGWSYWWMLLWLAEGCMPSVKIQQKDRTDKEIAEAVTREIRREPNHFRNLL